MADTDTHFLLGPGGSQGDQGQEEGGQVLIPQPLGLSWGWQQLRLSPVAQLYQVTPLSVSSLWGLVNTPSFGPFSTGMGTDKPQSLLLVLLYVHTHRHTNTSQTHLLRISPYLAGLYLVLRSSN